MGSRPAGPRWTWPTAARTRPTRRTTARLPQAGSRLTALGPGGHRGQLPAHSGRLHGPRAASATDYCSPAASGCTAHDAGPRWAQPTTAHSRSARRTTAHLPQAGSGPPHRAQAGIAEKCPPTADGCMGHGAGPRWTPRTTACARPARRTTARPPQTASRPTALGHRRAPQTNGRPPQAGARCRTEMDATDDGSRAGSATDDCTARRKRVHGPQCRAQVGAVDDGSRPAGAAGGCSGVGPHSGAVGGCPRAVGHTPGAVGGSYRAVASPGAVGGCLGAARGFAGWSARPTLRGLGAGLPVSVSGGVGRG
jgi:hypothetical protein